MCPDEVEVPIPPVPDIFAVFIYQLRERNVNLWAKTIVDLEKASLIFVNGTAFGKLGDD